MSVLSCGDGPADPGPTPPPPPPPPQPASVSIAPAVVEFSALGDTARLVAEVRDAGGRPIPGAAVAWSTSAASVAAVDASGLVRAVGVGEAAVAAAHGSVSGEAVVIVSQLADAVTVSPAAATLSVGDTLRLSAEAFDANGHRVRDAEFAWSSSNDAVATVDAAGWVRAVGRGATTIEAGTGDARGEATVSVGSSDRDALEAIYRSTGGPGWSNRANWLTDAPLGEWYGVETDADGRVLRLSLDLNNLEGRIPPEIGGLARLAGLALQHNRLAGPIPPELGELGALRYLSLAGNKLSGAIPPALGRLAGLEQMELGGNLLTDPIPPELGRLVDLRALGLSNNGLTGRIPPELGNLRRLGSLALDDNQLEGPIPPALENLANLVVLRLSRNRLTGPIPAELGNLRDLEGLGLSENRLAGPIPPELGNLANLEWLYLDGNRLTGTIPPAFGRLARLRELSLSNNPEMAGPLPSDLTAIAHLEILWTAGTHLCAPADPGFQAWLGRIPRRRVPRCDPPAAYLTQAVQSRGFPVPLVAGDSALLRVFPTAARASSALRPPVHATFYADGTEIHAAEIAAGSAGVPEEVDEGDLAASANAVIPGWVVQPGLEMVVEIDPGGTVDSTLGVRRRIPETGRLAVDVREMPAFGLTLLPFLRSSAPDSAVIRIVGEMAADPMGHDMLRPTRTLLPVGALAVTAHEPVLTSSSDILALLHETEAIRTLEGAGGHYQGLMTGGFTGASGIAFTPGWSSFSGLDSYVMAHELGHNLSLRHAPCGGPAEVDPDYPFPDGSIGVWGYNFVEERVIPPTDFDLMSYCGPQWIGDYNFSAALRFRLAREGDGGGAASARTARSLLLWGGVDASGEPFLEPAFLVDAPRTLSGAGGAYAMTGSDARGGTLFSLGFAMPETAGGEGSAFAFALPVRPEWAGRLARITLSGPGGTAVLDGRTDRPMVILRDPGSGRVRGFLRDFGPGAEPGAAAAETDARLAETLAAGRGLEALFSRGLPGPEAWPR